MSVRQLFDLKGKNALITGGGQGIGRAIAIAFAEQGANIVLNYRSNDSAAQETYNAIQALGGNVRLWKYDLDSESITTDFSKYAKENEIDVDILVLNASIQIRKNWEQVSIDEFDKQIRTNIRASLELIQCCIPNMRRNKWGRIVTLGSVQQYRPNPQMIVYAASKAAQHNMVKTLAAQISRDGITINNLSPGAIETIRNKEALSDAAYRKKIENSIPIGFVGQPDDIAPMALLLCSDAGRYITGADILIDGGMSIPQ